jgi:hypothetical protein
LHAVARFFDKAYRTFLCRAMLQNRFTYLTHRPDERLHPLPPLAAAQNLKKNQFSIGNPYHRARVKPCGFKKHAPKPSNNSSQNERMCLKMKRYIAGFALASCFGILCACAARTDMMLLLGHMLGR